MKLGYTIETIENDIKILRKKGLNKVEMAEELYLGHLCKISGLSRKELNKALKNLKMAGLIYK